jgi:hypothetical protein
MVPRIPRCGFEISATVAANIHGAQGAMEADLQDEVQEPISSLRQLAQAEACCTRCPLYRDATQAVPRRRPKPCRLHAGR